MPQEQIVTFTDRYTVVDPPETFIGTDGMEHPNTEAERNFDRVIQESIDAERAGWAFAWGGIAALVLVASIVAGAHFL